MRSIRLWPLTLLLTACAAYDGRDLVVGQATRAEVVARMGEPADSLSLTDGSTQLAYPRGPEGLHTFMVRLGPDGRLAGIENVLDHRYFAQIVPGESRRDDVRRLLGPPAEIRDFARRQEQSWDYRFRGVWYRTARFVVIFDSLGVVRQTYQQEEYLGDGMVDRH